MDCRIKSKIHGEAHERGSMLGVEPATVPSFLKEIQEIFFLYSKWIRDSESDF